MVFIGIMTAIMAASIFIIYKIAGHFGFRLAVPALVLCGVLAFAVNFVTIALSPFLTWEYYARIGIFVIIAAICVTWYNSYLIRKHPSKYKSNHDEGNASQVDQPNEAMPPESVTNSADVLESASEAHSEAVAEPAAKHDIEALVETNAEAFEGTDSTAIAKEQPQIKAEPTDDTGEPASETAEAKLADTEAIDEATKATPDTGMISTTASMSETEEPSATADEQDTELTDDVAEDEAAEPVLNPLLPAIIVPSIREQAKADIDAAIQKRMEKTLLTMDSLDALLDYAISQEGRGAHLAAINTYKTALSRYRTDDYAPYISIDLTNIYKELGFYDEAIHTSSDALKLLAVRSSKPMQAEFQKNVEYLHLVKYILSGHDAVNTPFREIPSSIMDEIEDAFERSERTNRE